MRKICLWFMVCVVTSLLADEPKGETTPEVAVPAENKVAAPETTKAFSGPQLQVKQRIEELFEASKLVNAAGAQKTTARSKIETSLDWDRIAKECLGAAEWKKRSKKDQQDFQRLLKEVVTKTAFSRMDTFWTETSYTFDKIDIKGSEAHVAAKFKIKEDNFLLDYYLAKKGASWFIHDIAFEDLRYSTNINEQISAFLREKPFASLLEKLKKRKEELDSPKTKKS